MHEPRILAPTLPATMHTLNEDPAKDVETAVSSDAEDHLPLTAKAHKHLSHVSADSVATTAFDDDDDQDDDRLTEHHRRSHSGSDSLYSVVTEATEATEPHLHQAKASPATTATTPTTVTTTTKSSADTPALSVSTNNHSNSAYLPINRDEQLDPWGSNPYDQEDLASTLHFSRRPGDELDEDELAAEEEQDKVTGLALKTSALTSPTTARPLSASAGGADPDTLERLDREFEMLTNGQAIQITTTAASSPLQLEFDREQLEDPRGIMERSIPDKDKKIKLSKMFSRAASNGDMNRIADMLDNFRDWIDIEAQDEDGTSPLIYAACFGHVEIAFMLLEAGAAVDARDKCKQPFSNSSPPLTPMAAAL